MAKTKNLSTKEQDVVLEILKERFDKNKNRHKGIDWLLVEIKIKGNTQRIWSLNEMEKSGGEPDVISYDGKTDTYLFVDCSAESPLGRRSLCYDAEALQARKEFKPQTSALEMAAAMGIELLTDAQYKDLQKLGKFDSKTSSWIKTPSEIRKLGGALFADFRYNTVFVYHNGASSYYAVRGFRGCLNV